MFTRKRVTTLFALALLIVPLNGKKENGTIYVLFWTAVKDTPWWYYRNLDNERGYAAFVSRNCSFQNCYLTTNRTHFESILEFDVLLFNAVHLSHGYDNSFIPTNRTLSQLYVLFSVEPAAYNSIFREYNGIFNLTWTYVLSSDIVHPYFIIKNTFDEIIAPKLNTYWIDIKDMSPTDPTIVKKLEHKSIAALWVVSHCVPARRKVFIERLSTELSKYGHQLDIFGACGDQTKCPMYPKGRNGRLGDECYSRIQSDYYFYLAFENSFTEDYVSEKVLHALKHFSVPIVFGGANYTRFLPDGIYLNALKLDETGLARQMASIINNRQEYYNFFKWHKYYTVYDPFEDSYRESVCAFCAFLNDRTKRNVTQIYQNITEWWNSDYPEETFDLPITASTTTEFAAVTHSGHQIQSDDTIFSNIIDFFVNLV